MKKNWTSYADDLNKTSKAEGVYTIDVERAGDVRHLYVGQTNNIRRWLEEHKNKKMEIGKFVKGKFSQRNAGETLRIKWVEERNSKCAEGEYIACMEKKLPYKLKYNKNVETNVKGGKKIVEGRKVGRASKTNRAPHLAQGLDPPL